jgi:hypothetical protein
MEMYDECNICGKWDDLIRWQARKEVYKTDDEESIVGLVTIAYACSDCYNKLETYTIRGFTKVKALAALQKEMTNGKK